MRQFRHVGLIAWVSVEVGAARFSLKLTLTYVILPICTLHVHVDARTAITADHGWRNGI